MEVQTRKLETRSKHKFMYFEIQPLQQLSEVTDPSNQHPPNSVHNSEVKPIKRADVHTIMWLDSTND